MAEDDMSIQEMAFTAGYWTEGVVRGTLGFLPALVVFSVSAGVCYLVIGSVIKRFGGR